MAEKKPDQVFDLGGRSPISMVSVGLFLMLLVCRIPPAFSEDTPFSARNAWENLVYVPAYSHIFYGDSDRPFQLSVTLSIRNTDPVKEIEVISVGYHDSDGKPVRMAIEKPIRLKPFATTYCRVPESDATGGVNAFFLVLWKGDPEGNPPLVEAVMIGASGQQGISFTSRGVPLPKPRVVNPGGKLPRE